MYNQDPTKAGFDSRLGLLLLLNRALRFELPGLELPGLEVIGLEVIGFEVPGFSCQSSELSSANVLPETHAKDL
jgi:hypothetical protein